MAQNAGPGWVRGSGQRDCPPGYPVKGNEPGNSYYQPGDPGYSQVIPEMCFADAQAAERSGFTHHEAGSGRRAAGAAAGGAGAAAAAGFVKAAGGRDCPSGFPVKASEPANIFYEPSDAGYAQVVPEVCFASVDEATKAGFTKVSNDAVRRDADQPAAKPETKREPAPAPAAPRREAGATEPVRAAAPPPPPPPPPPPAQSTGGAGGNSWLKWLLPLAALVVLALGIWYFTQDDEEEVDPTPTVAADVVATPDDEEVVTDPVETTPEDEATPVEVVGTLTDDATPVSVLATPVDDATPVAAVDDEPVDEATPVEVIATPVDDVATPPDAIAVDATPALEQEATPEIVVAATPVDATPEAADEVTIAMRDIFFEPNEFTIPANTDVTVILPNEGAAPHDFVIDALDINTDEVSPGGIAEVVINAPAGTYEFYCSVPGHREAGMVGTLIVE